MKSMISENLQFLRKNAKFSQEELADKLGVSHQAVAKWEIGETVPDIALIKTDGLTGLFKIFSEKRDIK